MSYSSSPSKLRLPLSPQRSSGERKSPTKRGHYNIPPDHLLFPVKRRSLARLQEEAIQAVKNILKSRPDQCIDALSLYIEMRKWFKDQGTHIYEQDFVSLVESPQFHILDTGEANPLIISLVPENSILQNQKTATSGLRHHHWHQQLNNPVAPKCGSSNTPPESCSFFDRDNGDKIEESRNSSSRFASTSSSSGSQPIISTPKSKTFSTHNSPRKY